MLAIATVRQANTTAFAAARGRGADGRFGAKGFGRALYQKYSTYGANGSGRSGSGKWISRMLSYLRSGLQSLVTKTPTKTSAAKLFSQAGRLSQSSGAGWVGRLVHRATLSQIGGGHGTTARTVIQKLTGQLRVWSGASRLTAAHRLSTTSTARWAFGNGGKWSPFLNLFAQSMRSLSSPSHLTSARVVMAQIQRQAMAGMTTQQRRNASVLSPLAHETCIRLLNPNDSLGAAAEIFAGNYKKQPQKKTNAAALSDQQPNTATTDLHPVAKATQKRAIAVDRCVTITIPCSISVPRMEMAADSSSPKDMMQMLTDANEAQQRHNLLLSRLLEKLSATGWDISYQVISQPNEYIQVALSPSSGITSASKLESLLCDWGFDMSLFAATISNPRVPPKALSATVSFPSSKAVSNDTGISSPWELDGAMDSRLFSLIVDEVVDPEEAYRDEVRDFLVRLDKMPRISSTTVAPAKM